MHTKKEGKPNQMGWSLDISVDPVMVESPKKNGWMEIDIEATQEQPVKLEIELHSSRRTIKLSCTTTDLKMKEIIRRKKTPKEVTGDTKFSGTTKSVITNAHKMAKAGLTTKEAAEAIRDSGRGKSRVKQLKEGDANEPSEKTSPANIL